MSKRYNTEQVIERFKDVHGDRYDYSKYVYPGRKELKGIVICREHGEFEIMRQHHEKGSGCPVCAGVPRGGFKRKGQDKFLNEMRNIFGNSLDFSKFVYVNNRIKGTVICPIHGEFEKNSKHLMRGQGCPICSGKVKLSLDSIQERLNSIHGDNHYTILPDLEYINNKTNVMVRCNIHDDVWLVRPDNLLNSKTRCPKCADRISKIEQELYDYVSSFGVEIVQNSKKIIEPLELDIYLPEHSLAIEMNGLFFHGDRSNKDKKYHLNKTERCLEQDIRLLHIFEDEWRNKQEIWKSIIRNKLKRNTERYYARKCEIREVSIQQASQFLSINHLQGYSQSSVRLGLYCDNEMVCILTMGKSRFDKTIEWEICRFATKLNSNVCGGFHRLLKRFILDYDPSSIVTYADRRYSEGDLYKNFGMVEEKNDALNYFYFNKHEMVRHSRHKFQKHKLESLLPLFDINLSESDNMRVNGYDRIWDCGNYKYAWRKNEETQGSSAPWVSD
jgi:G:T-mismatch repair DNA endonuclease (very short patch repair protein)